MLENGKVLFIIHDLYQDDVVFPCSIGYLAAVLKQRGAKVEIYSQDVYHYSYEHLANYLKNKNFDLIGLGFLAARFNETILPLCKIINKYKKNAWLVLGGHGPSPIPEFIIKKTKCNVIVIGEGEETIIELLKNKLEGGDLSKVNGIAYQEKENVNINKRRPLIKNLDIIPFPEYSLFPMDYYLTAVKFYKMDKNGKFHPIIASRGCIGKCNFCYRIDKGYRYRSIPNVVDEIAFLQEKYNVSYFRMEDDLFTYPRKRIFEFYDELEKRDLKIKWDTMARVDTIDDETIDILQDLGCQWLNIGFESSDDNVLKLMNKRTTVEQNINAAKIIRKSSIGLGLNFIWGNKGDNEKTLKKDVKFIKKYNTYFQLRTIRPVTPYPGCELYYEAIEKGLLKGPEDFFVKFKNSDLLTVNFTDIPDEKFYKFLFEANKELIIDHYENTTKNMEEANKLIQDFYDLYFCGKINFRGARHYLPEEKNI